MKQGVFFGQFSRLLVRVGTKLKDKRYGFLFQAPESLHTYEAFHALARQLLDFTGQDGHVKVVDFSEVPADALPIVLGIVARLIFYLQFWMPQEKRHPVALICDEAHIYLPREAGNPNENRAIENFEKIAKGGRKYGVSLVIVSQRPADVSATILSQCNNVVALRLTNSEDQNVVKKADAGEPVCPAGHACRSWTSVKRWSSVMRCYCPAAFKSPSPRSHRKVPRLTSGQNGRNPTQIQTGNWLRRT